VELLFVDAACRMKRRDSEIFNSAARSERNQILQGRKKRINVPALGIRHTAVREQHLEGIVGKLKDSPYQPGKRSGALLSFCRMA